MTPSSARVAVLAAAMLTMPLSTHGAAGEERYPSRPVKMIVSCPAGGPTDAIARLVANKLGAALGGSFYVENVPGAGGTLGARAAAAAAPDGYTLLWVTPDLVVQALVKHRVPYDPFMGFSPISLVATAPEAIMVHPSIPAKTLYELVALLNANPPRFAVIGNS